MSTTSDAPSPKVPEPTVELSLDVIDSAEEATPQQNKLMSNISQLETDLDTEKEERKEERFIWACAVVVLLNALVLVSIGGGSFSFTLLFLFQLVVMLGVANKLGVDWAVRGIGWLLHQIAKHLDKD